MNPMQVRIAATLGSSVLSDIAVDRISLLSFDSPRSTGTGRTRTTAVQVSAHYTRIPNPETRIPKPESRIPNPETRIPAVQVVPSNRLYKGYHVTGSPFALVVRPNMTDPAQSTCDAGYTHNPEQYTIYHIPCTMYHIPYTIYRIPYTIYHVPYTIYHIPYTV